MRVLATKGDYRLYNDGCATAPYLITIEKRKLYGDCEVWIKAHETLFTGLKEAMSVMMDMYNQETHKEEWL